MACKRRSWGFVAVISVIVACGLAAAADEGKVPSLSWVRCGESTSSPGRPAVCGLNDDLVAEVVGLKVLEDDAAKAKRQIVLFLAGHAARDLPYEKVPGKPGEISFRLVRTSDKENRALWSRILGRPLARVPVVSVAVGLDDASSVADGGRVCQAEFPLLRFRAGTLLLLGVILVLVLGGVYVARSDSILRDSAFPPPVIVDQPPGEAPYSLGRCQMAWWFFNITAAFVLIWAATGDFDTVTPQALALMGISGSTALFSTVIDANKRGAAKIALDRARARYEELEALAGVPREQDQKLKDLQGPLLDTRLREAASAYRVAETTSKGPGKSKGFLHDTLANVNGYAFHRLQVLVWTVLLTIVFWDAVWRDLAMPTFSDTLLALMGISSGTYIGFKIPEPEKAP